MILICKPRDLNIYALLMALFLCLGGKSVCAEAQSQDASLVAVCALLKEDPTRVAGAPSAAYVPNVDAYGRSVKPVHGDGAAPQSYRFNFSIDVAKRYMNLPQGVEMHSDVLPLEISPDGQVALGDADRTQEFRALCAEHYRQ